MKKIILSILTAIFLISAVSLDVSAAKKGSKLSKEAVQQMSDDIDNLTKKIYSRTLLSPQDNETLIGIKIQLDNQMLMSPSTELAPLYYKAGNVYRLRDMKSEAIDCYQTILENFRDTALAPKAQAALEDLGITVTAPKLSDNEEESEDGI
ncbi:MAG: hypothetical protein NC408_07640 [Candidatus Gastranaerophilales bacterium]|nr:hypothetical protein [Candidatus Gastranaerophilales bacterium]MCM1072508.1 hypothetical protein [Bacteroides sp.]